MSPKSLGREVAEKCCNWLCLPPKPPLLPRRGCLWLPRAQRHSFRGHARRRAPLRGGQVLWAMRGEAPLNPQVSVPRTLTWEQLSQPKSDHQAAPHPQQRPRHFNSQREFTIEEFQQLLSMESHVCLSRGMRSVCLGAHAPQGEHDSARGGSPRPERTPECVLGTWGCGLCSLSSEDSP